MIIGFIARLFSVFAQIEEPYPTGVQHRELPRSPRDLIYMNRMYNNMIRYGILQIIINNLNI